jgi:hypothetical protein
MTSGAIVGTEDGVVEALSSCWETDGRGVVVTVAPEFAETFVGVVDVFAAGLGAGFKRVEAPTKTNAEAVMPPARTFKMRGAVEP